MAAPRQVLVTGKKYPRGKGATSFRKIAEYPAPAEGVRARLEAMAVLGLVNVNYVYKGARP